ncbi:hypothetical protein ACJRO7_003408 [Eucalyptus globulus]|uniref:Uncharacterized protein n=1 Tax=Eucalyptus globulus TaxID=34317 RepID=A0ABD3IWT7_EUCGL
MSTWSSSMEQRFKEQPTLLTPSAGNQSCCICRAPRSLVQFNEKAFQPQIVSIGPYHHGKERLNMVEQHKPRFFSALIERTKDGGVGLDHYFTAVALKENEIRDCYSEFLPCESKALIEMMVLDACFIVEVFRIFGRVIWSDWDDPIFTTQWIFPFLIKDLLQIENQIPFSVLQVVFDLSKGDIADKAATPSLNELALGFFNSAFQRPQEQLEKFFGVSRPRVFNVKHLLDLFRLSFIGHTEVEQPANVYVDYLQLIPSATQLLLSGINCMPRNDCNLNLLDVQFNHGILQIPPLTLDDCMSSFLLNCVAFEQSFNYSSRHLSSYIIFMRCLVSTEKGAELLSENRILLNYLGSNAEVATFFNDLSMGITIDISTSYLAAIFGQVNRYHEMFLPRTRRYFAASWSTIVSVASFVVSVFTFVSAFYTIYAYYSPRK